MRLSRLAAVLPIACAACGSAPPRAAHAGTVRADSTLSAGAPSAAAAQEVRSVRTSLREADCETVRVDEEAGGSTQRCAGTAGYRLLAVDGDARMSVTVVDPAGREHPLEFWATVTGAFSSLGEEAEWRVRGEGAAAVPIALVVPLGAHEHPDEPERVTPYRVVVKITPSETCATRRLPAATPDAEVRRLADASADQPCLTSYRSAGG